MDSITIDGMDEHAFRHRVEDMLRLDRGHEAVTLLRGLLEPYARPGGILPPRFLDVTANDLEITGWDRLASRLAQHDRPEHPISAIGIALADARTLGGPGPRDGRLQPFIKTFYFNDEAYPFTEATRDDLLDGYTREGFGWHGDYHATDATLAIRGIDDLHGAIIELEDRLLDHPSPSEDEIRAGTIGACFVAVLIHQALRRAVRKAGLPRPVCVLAACDGVYPFFDAPVSGWEAGTPEDDWPNELEDAVLESQIAAAEPLPAAAPVRESSLLNLSMRRGVKELALAVGEEEAREAARFTAQAGAQQMHDADESGLRGLLHGLAAAAPPPAPLFAEPEPPPRPEPAFEPASEGEPAPEPEAEQALPPETELPEPLAAAALSVPPSAEATDAETPPPPIPLPPLPGAGPTGSSLRNKLRAEQQSAAVPVPLSQTAPSFAARLLQAVRRGLRAAGLGR